MTPVFPADNNMSLLQRLWSDETGFVLSTELVLVGTIAVIGLLTGMTTLRNAVVQEMSDVAGAVQDLNQTYSFNGINGHSASTQGSDFIDNRDYCDSAEDANPGSTDNCLSFTSLDPADEAS